MHEGFMRRNRAERPRRAAMRRVRHEKNVSQNLIEHSVILSTGAVLECSLSEVIETISGCPTCLSV